MLCLTIFAMKIVCLGNEFLEIDSLAKEVGKLLCEDYNVVNVKDSFELMEILLAWQEEVGSGKWEVGSGLVILDVVEGLEEVRRLEVGDLRVDSIASAHDFDAAYVLALFGHDSGEPKLLDVDVGIVGIPMSGDAGEIAGEVRELIGEKF